MHEQWRDVLGIPGHVVSNLGRVKRLAYRNASGKMLRERVLKNGSVRDKKRNYIQIRLCFDGKILKRYLHQLVLEAFVGPRPDGMFACHNNGNAADNRPENLRWDTPSANSLDKLAHGTMARGERNGRAVLSDEDVSLAKGLIKAGLPIKVIARRFAVNDSAIHRIKSEKTHKWLPAREPTPEELKEAFSHTRSGRWGGNQKEGTKRFALAA